MWPDRDPVRLVRPATASDVLRVRGEARQIWLGIAGTALAVVALVATMLVREPWHALLPDAPVAAPPTEGPVGAAERLRGPLNLVRSGMAGWADDPTVPDPSAALPCPDATLALDLSFTADDPKPAGINAVGGTLSGCAWTDDPAGEYAAHLRVDVSLHALADITTDAVVRRLEAVVARDGCDWASPVPDRSFNALMVCETDDHRVWTLVVADDDGSGAWVVTTAVGADLSRAFNTGAELTAYLWEAVTENTAEGPTPGPRVTRMNREFVELVDGLAARGRPMSLGGDGDRSCREATAELSFALDSDLYQGPEAGSTPWDPLCWWTVGPPPTDDAEFVETLAFYVTVEEEADYASHHAYVDIGAQEVFGPDGPAAPDGCLGADLPLAQVRTTVLACALDGHTRWSVVSASPDGEELWVLDVYVPADSGIDRSDAVLALVDVADRSW